MRSIWFLKMCLRPALRLEPGVLTSGLLMLCLPLSREMRSVDFTVISNSVDPCLVWDYDLTLTL